MVTHSDWGGVLGPHRATRALKPGCFSQKQALPATCLLWHRTVHQFLTHCCYSVHYFNITLPRCGSSVSFCDCCLMTFWLCFISFILETGSKNNSRVCLLFIQNYSLKHPSGCMQSLSSCMQSLSSSEKRK